MSPEQSPEVVRLGADDDDAGSGIDVSILPRADLVEQQERAGLAALAQGWSP